MRDAAAGSTDPTRGIDDRIRQEARIVGLKELDVPTLDSIERRRLGLWIVMSVVLVGVALALFATTMWSGEELPGWLGSSPVAGRVAALGLVGTFCAYAIEKEVHLRRLTRLLVDERVLVAALSSRIKELSALLDAGRAMNAVLALDEVLERILDNALELLGGSNGSIMLLQAGGVLEAVSVRGNDAAIGAVVPLGEGVAGRVAATGEPVLIQGELREGGLRRRNTSVDSAMSVPLVHRDAVLGVININARQDRTFTEYDLRALSLFAEHAAGAIANARLYETSRSAAAALAHQASHDPLTDLLNRTVLVDRIGAALARHAGPPAVLAVFFIDLDGFKWVNDGLGHAAGDRLLVAAADRLRSELRGSDTVSRFGGDEFAVLCESLDNHEHALAIGRRLTAAFAAPFALDGRTVRLSASVGIAVAGDDDTPDSLLRNADLAMYRVKENGRNGMEVFTADMRTRAGAERADVLDAV